MKKKKMSDLISSDEMYEKLNEIGGCGAKPDTWEKGWDDAIDAAIGFLRDAHRYNPIQKRSDFEVFEYCPHCDTEIGVIWDVESDGYEIYCPNCGEKIMLCSMCPNINKCDWKADSNGKGCCMMKRKPVKVKPRKVKLFTWDDLCKRADGKGYGSNELTAKDEARHQLGILIKTITGSDIELSESPEEEIEFFLSGKVAVLFDKSGNIKRGSDSE